MLVPNFSKHMNTLGVSKGHWSIPEWLKQRNKNLDNNDDYLTRTLLSGTSSSCCLVVDQVGISILFGCSSSIFTFTKPQRKNSLWNRNSLNLLWFWFDFYYKYLSSCNYFATKVRNMDFNTVIFDLWYNVKINTFINIFSLAHFIWAPVRGNIVN